MKFQVGDRVRLVENLEPGPNSNVWSPGNVGVVVNATPKSRGYAGPKLGIVAGPTYGVRFDNFMTYGTADNHHTAAEIILEHEVSDEEIMEAIRSIGRSSS